MKGRESEEPKQPVVFMHRWIIGDNRELTMQFVIALLPIHRFDHTRCMTIIYYISSHAASKT